MSMVVRTLAMALVAGATLAACGGGGDGATVATNRTAGQGITLGEPNGGVPVVSEYIKLAQDAACASTRNNLYLVDNKYVLWDRAGQCADNAYGQTLMGPTPEAVLCQSGDTIAGPRTSCTDANLRSLFDTMLKNLDKADLGLGAGHKVERVPFLPTSGAPVAFTTVVGEGFSNITAPRQVVVKDGAAWAALWAEHSKTRIAAPEVDFSRQMLVGVFAGDVDSGCKTVSVLHVGTRDGRMVVEYEERDITPVAICLPVVSQPMQVVAVPRSDVPVEFVKAASDWTSFQSIDSGTRSGVQTPRKLVVRDPAAWAALWREHAGGDAPVPKIDFGRQMVIGVFLGAQPSGCYATGIESVRHADGKLKVRHVDTQPGPGVFCTMAITYPAHLVVVDRSEVPVEFSQEIRLLK
ncbi:protease complex subunit PrcB family protein [Massilia consociata]|uniref:Protease complex subunit PrcB family protein n=1 Tax=Massilia consociata TaxID=760117 RepID=A0ABV6FCK9_9BURK